MIQSITSASGTDGTGTREVVSYVYQRIIWTWEDGGITSEDSWDSVASS